jgi:hypothetical protein
VPDDRWMRQVLMRRTHRRYSDQPVRNRIFSRPRSSGCRTALAATGSPP